MLGRRRARVQVQQHLGVAGRLEDRPLLDTERVAQFLRVDEIAVVRDGDLAVGAVDQNRLGVRDAAGARRRVADVPDRAGAGQPSERRLVEPVGDVAHGLVNLQARAIRGRDARALLASMLQRVEAQVGKVGRLGVTVDTEDAAFFSGTCPWLNSHSWSRDLPEPPSRCRRRSRTDPPRHSTSTTGRRPA